MDITTLEQDLTKMIGGAVTTSEFERLFYASDFVPMPKWIKAFFKTVPIAVVKPATVQDVSVVLSYCHRKGIPVVPRGGGTSGLFGAVPKKGGVVLDLRGLSSVVDINTEEQSVTVQTGQTWWELDVQLRKKGLTLKSYPTSARSATIGGWLMGAGLGVGSLMYGPVSNQLLSAEIVLSDGSTRIMTSQDDISWLCETEGILGILTTVTFAVRKIPEEVVHFLLSFEKMSDLFDVVRVLARMEQRPYAVEIYDHHYLSLVKQSGLKTQDYIPPGGGTLLVAWDIEKERPSINMGILETLAIKHNGSIEEGAEEEWNQRFNMLRIRRAVPTVIPVGVHIPIDRLAAFYESMEKLRKRTIGLVGHVISADDCMAMFLLVTDRDDSIEFCLSLQAPSRIFSLARTYGGKPGGGIGVWNAPVRNDIISSERAEHLKMLKKDLDTKGILNPGMWDDVPFILNPGIYAVSMKALSLLDRILPKRPIEMKLDPGFKSCVQCGYCMNYCPTKQEWISSTPRGRILLTDESHVPTEITSEYVKSIFECSLCGRCAVDCSVSIDSPGMWVDLRSKLAKKGLEPESMKAITKVIGESHNTASKVNDQRANWAKKLRFPVKVNERAEVVYFVGCVTSFYPMVQDIARSFSQILQAADVDFSLIGGDEWCCGYPLISAGHKDAAAASMLHNVEAVKRTGAKTVVVTCPGCLRMWKDEYFRITGEGTGIEVFHSSEYILKLLEGKHIGLNELRETITYHDPCDLGRVSGIFDQPRSIIAGIPGVSFKELESSKEYCNCCGSGGNLLVTNQDLSLSIAKKKVEEAQRIGAQSLITGCPSCVRSITMAKTAEKIPLNILDITQLVWKVLEKREVPVGRGADRTEDTNKNSGNGVR